MYRGYLEIQIYRFITRNQNSHANFKSQQAPYKIKILKKEKIGPLFFLDFETFWGDRLHLFKSRHFGPPYSAVLTTICFYDYPLVYIIYLKVSHNRDI